MRFHSKAIHALSAIAASTGVAVGQPAPSVASWVGDVRFEAIHDMYWRARLQSRYVGNRLCALKENSRYDDPKSPFRPLDQRLNAAENRIERIWPRALNAVVRPYQMPPPQLLCEDERTAWEAIFALETAITALERLLDNAGDRSAEARGEK